MNGAETNHSPAIPNQLLCEWGQTEHLGVAGQA